MTVNHGVLGSSPCSGAFGSLAQLVQSICLTSRGSGVRIPQLPQKYDAEQTTFKSSVLFCACGCVQAPATAPNKTRHGRSLCILWRVWYCLLKVGVARIELCLLLGLQPTLIWYPREDEPAARPSNPLLSTKNKRSKKVSRIRHLLFFSWGRCKLVCIRLYEKNKIS